MTTRFLEGATFGHGFVYEGCTAFCCKCGFLRNAVLAPGASDGIKRLWEAMRAQAGEGRCPNCGHVHCLGMCGESLPGFAHLYAGEAPFNDVQDDYSMWNKWLRRDDYSEWSCVCGTKLSVHAASCENDATEAGWHKSTDGGWYCSVRCDIGESLDRERWRPRRRLTNWERAGVNVWMRVARHITAENYPSPYGYG